MSKWFLLFVVLAVILVPLNGYAWGPGAHIGISLSVIDQLPAYLKLLLMENINEFLYGSLAPDFIVGKTLSDIARHTHNWDIGFEILRRAEDDQGRAFAYGYLSHLAADAVAHGIMINGMDGKFKNAKHTIIELIADNMYPSTYRHLAEQVLKKNNRELDENFKGLVESVLFSFGVSKLIFKGMVRVSLGRRVVKKAVLNEKLLGFLSLNVERIRDYLDLSKQFSLDVLTKGMDSPVVKISAISR